MAITQPNQQKLSVDQAKQEITKEIEKINTKYGYELVTKARLMSILTDFFEKNTQIKILSTKKSLYTTLGDYFLSSHRQFLAEQFYQRGGAKSKLKKLLITSGNTSLAQGDFYSAEKYYEQAGYIHGYKKIADFFYFGTGEVNYRLAADSYYRAKMYTKAKKSYKKAAEIYEKNGDYYYAANAYSAAGLTDKSNKCLITYAESLEKEGWKRFYELRPGRVKMEYNERRGSSLYQAFGNVHALDSDSKFSEAEELYKRAGADDKIRSMRINVGDALSESYIDNDRPSPIYSLAVEAYEKAGLFESTDIEELGKLFNAYSHTYNRKGDSVRKKIQQLRKLSEGK